MDEIYGVIEEAKRLERLKVMREMLELVDEVRRDGGDLEVYQFRLDARTKDFARKALR